MMEKGQDQIPDEGFSMTKMPRYFIVTRTKVRFRARVRLKVRARVRLRVKVRVRARVNVKVRDSV
jgi:acyl-CoA thioesterase FadM